MAKAGRSSTSAEPDRAGRRCVAGWLLAAAFSGVAATASAQGPVGAVTHSSGTVSVKRADGSIKLIGIRSEVFEGDQISTESDTYTRVKFRDGAEVTVRPNSQVMVANYSFQENRPAADNMVIGLIKGGLRAVTGLLGKRNQNNVQFRAPTATIGIRGTNFGMLLCQNDCGGIPTVSGQAPDNGLHLDVADGQIVASNAGGTLQVAVGQFAFVGGKDTPPVIVPPAQGIRVTVPPAFRSGSSRGVGSGSDRECSVQ